MRPSLACSKHALIELQERQLPVDVQLRRLQVGVVHAWFWRRVCSSEACALRSSRPVLPDGAHSAPVTRDEPQRASSMHAEFPIRPRTARAWPSGPIGSVDANCAETAAEDSGRRRASRRAGGRRRAAAAQSCRRRPAAAGGEISEQRRRLAAKLLQRLRAQRFGARQAARSADPCAHRSSDTRSAGGDPVARPGHAHVADDVALLNVRADAQIACAKRDI